MNELHAVHVVEAALRLSGNPMAWMVPVADEFSRAWPDPLATTAQEYEIVEGEVRLLNEVQRGPLGLQLSRAGLQTISSEQVAHVYGKPAQCVSATEVLGDPLPRALSQQWGMSGVRDVVGVFSRDAEGHGVAVAAALPNAVQISPRARARWIQVAHQLGLAARLHRMLGTTSLDALPHARLDGAGRVLDAAGDAGEIEVRAQLRELVRTLERARAAAEHGDVDSALKMWEQLARGEWVLVDQFDADGKRHVVAAPCPAAASLRALSSQQEAVARAAGEGLSSREIGKQLGLSERAVDNQLARAMQKLGIPNRVALVRLFTALERGGHVS